MIGRIGNSLFGMEFVGDGSRSFVRQGSRSPFFILRSLYEFALQADWGEYSGLITSGECEKEECFEKEAYTALWRHPFFEVQVRYRMEETAVVKSMRLRAKRGIFLRYAQTEVSDCSLPLSRGGEGQPVFLGDAGFVSMVFPAARNRYEGKRLKLEQAPYLEVLPGEDFVFFDIVYGFCTEKTAEDSFLQYILAHKKKTPAGLRIYGDWGAHDEMAGEKELDEQLSFRQLSLLKKGKERGVSFDYYLMDAFWYDRKGNYLTFLEKNWPQGPERFLEELAGQDMKFGLWFDVNMSRLVLPEELLEEKGNSGGLCMGYEENVKMLFRGIRTQLERCGCSLLKLDFAYFDCENGKHRVHSPERLASKEPAIRNFLRELTGLCQEYPDLLIAGYNGFTADLECIASSDRRKGEEFAISPWWCLYLDYLYCGDPRPSELPAGNLGNSLIWYTDAMIEKFSESLMPLTAIDDHGTMIGNTNTIYYLGKGNFRDSWILNIARGSRRELLYGDLELLNEEDWRFLADCRELFEFICRPSVHTVPVGGSPARGEVYGYVNGDGKRGYVTLVNPGAGEAFFRLTGEEWDPGRRRLWKIYAGKNFLKEGNKEEKSKGEGRGAEIRLTSEEVAVYAWEQREIVEKEGYLILDPAACETIRLSGSCGSFSVKVTDRDGKALRLLGGEKDPLQVQSPEEEAGLERVYPQRFWSGCSWMAYRIKPSDVSAGRQICLSNRGKECLYVKWQEEDSREFSVQEENRNGI